MKFSIVLRYCGDFAAQLNILVCNAAHLIKRLDIPDLHQTLKCLVRERPSDALAADDAVKSLFARQLIGF